MASAVPAARSALYTSLSALTAVGQPLENVGVYRTGLWREARQSDRVTLLNAVDIRREVAALATTAPFREEFTLQVAVEVYRKGPADDIDVVEDRLWAIITEVEQLVMSDRTLGGAVRQAMPGDVNEQSGPSGNDEDTLVAFATLQIDCWARVFLT